MAIDTELVYSLFDHIGDTEPKPVRATWWELATFLTNMQAIDIPAHSNLDAEKERLPLWCPVEFHEGASRSAAGARRIYCMVLDIDDGWDHEQFTEVWKSRGWAFAVHSTMRHSPDKPKWRAIFPLAYAVHAADWPRVWAKLAWNLSLGFENLVDKACKDASRFYYVPAYPEGAEHFCEIHDGRAIAPSQLSDPPKEETAPPPPPPPPREPGEELLAGDDFNARGSWMEMLLAAGWTFIRSRGLYDYWTRPGKKKGISARTGVGRVGDRFWSWSSNVAPIPGNKLLTKFHVYAHLHHGGDFKAAAKSLGALGYGEKGWKREKPKPAAKLEPPAAAPVIGLDSPIPEIPTEYELTTTANARRLIVRHGENLRYCRAYRSWLIWGGSWWVLDQNDGSHVKRLARDMAIEFGKTSWNRAMLVDPSKAQKWARDSMQHTNINHTVASATWQEGVEVNVGDLDQRRDFLPVKNGTLNLRTGALVPSKREHLMTKGIDIAYNPQAECPTWIEFLTYVLPDKELYEYVWSAVGYSLTGHTSSQCLFFLLGGGRNGKSTLISTLLKLLGPFGCRVAAETLMAQAKKDGAAPSPDIADLRGARMAATSEIEAGAKLAEATVKNLTGEETVKARAMYKDPIEFLPSAKFWMVGNVEPRIVGVDVAIWRRIKLIPFRVLIPTEKVDPNLMAKLELELEGILAWAAAGARRWYANGLPACAAVEDATQEYRSSQDTLHGFIESCCLRGEMASASTVLHQNVFERYQRWAQSEGIFKPMSSRALGIALRERGFVSFKSNGLAAYRGVELLHEERDNYYQYHQKGFD